MDGPSEPVRSALALLPVTTNHDDQRDACNESDGRHQRPEARPLAEQLAAGWPETVSEVHKVILEEQTMALDPRIWGRLS